MTYYSKHLIFFILIFFGLFSCKNNQDKILIYAGSASKPATEEIIKLFEEKTGIKAEIVFGGSGYVLSQMIMSKQGDVFFPGSSDYMEIAKRDKLVFENTEERVCYLISAINVQKGNPKNIQTLKDLLKPNIKVAIANPEGVCVGSFAIEIIENNFSETEIEQFRENLINYTGSCSKTATAISLKSVDAVIGWRVFEYWDSENIETIKLDKSEIVRVGYIPIAVSKFTKNKGLADEFIKFIKSEESGEIFKKYHYFSEPEQVFEYIGEEKPIGGVYNVPKYWLN